MKIAVCEDNTEDRDLIQHYITSYCKKNHFLVDIDAYDDGCALLNAYSKENYQVLFLDIVMAGISGIEAARKIREQNDQCLIVFITISKDYSLDAYGVDGLTYVLKPLDEKKMSKALDKCRRVLTESSRFITIPADGQGSLDIPVSQIHYIEVYNKKVIFHAGDQNFTASRMNLDKICEMLGGEPFMRCHRSYIVNMNYIDQIKKGKFIMKNGDSVLIPLRAYKEVQTAFGRFLTKKMKEQLI